MSFGGHFSPSVFEACCVSSYIASQIFSKVSGKAGGTSFTLKGPGGSVSLTPTDSMLIGGQLFIGSDILKRIGLPVQGVNWNP